MSRASLFVKEQDPRQKGKNQRGLRNRPDGRMMSPLHGIVDCILSDGVQESSQKDESRQNIEIMKTDFPEIDQKKRRRPRQKRLKKTVGDDRQLFTGAAAQNDPDAGPAQTRAEGK